MKPSARSGFRSASAVSAFWSSRSAFVDRGGRLLLLDAALALLHVLHLEVALLHAQPRRQQLLLVLDRLELEVLARLRELGPRLGEQGLVLPDLLLEGGGVEEDEQVPRLDHRALGREGDDLRLVALDGRGVGHGAQGLKRPRLRDRDPEGPLAHLHRGEVRAGAPTAQKRRTRSAPAPPRRASERRGRLRAEAARERRFSRVHCSRRSQGRASRASRVISPEARRAAARARAARARGASVVTLRTPSPRRGSRWCA